MQAQQRRQTQKTLSLSERFAAMAPKKPANPVKPTQTKMQAQLHQHATLLAVEGFIASDPNLGVALKHLNGQRSRHMDLPKFLTVDKFEASVSRIIGDDRRSAKTLEGLVAQAVCERLAAHFAVPIDTVNARCRFMTGSEGTHPNGVPHFILSLRWQSH